MLTALLPLCAMQGEMTNTFFTNLSSATFDTDELYVLGLGMNHIVTPQLPDWKTLNTEYERFARRIYCHDFFGHPSAPDSERTDQPPAGCENFRIPNPGWHPRDVDGYEPSTGVLEYVEQTRADIRDILETAKRSRPIRNLQRRHRMALQRLRQRDDVIFIDTDKNLGLACLDTQDYVQMCTAELAETHHLLPATTDALQLTRSAIVQDLLPLSETLPEWAKLWCDTATAAHPRTGAQYTIPSFRCTIKVHKSPPATRPITGNQKWITQPYAELIAKLLQPYVEELGVWTRDADQINNLLDSTVTADTDLLLTYDIVRLYPSIPHELCYTLLRRHLHARNCAYADWIVTALRIVLNYNFCIFDGQTYQQWIGFATGIACGAEVANLFIFILTRFVFSRYSDQIRAHQRYIDDGFIIWKGTAAAAEQLFAELNALCPQIQNTFTISETSAIFLDLDIFKGDRWHRDRLLDSKCYQKPVNKYLYTPFSSEHPRHCFLGIIHGELKRYIKRCSSRLDFLIIATLLRARLKARGFPEKFLAAAYRSTPRYDDRAKFLKQNSTRTTSPVIVFSTTFSSNLQNSRLSLAIFKIRAGYLATSDT
eukprot:SAG31_NODE_3402_length_4313_cov_7.421690_2_plen_597_part_00